MVTEQQHARLQEQDLILLQREGTMHSQGETPPRQPAGCRRYNC